MHHKQNFYLFSTECTYFATCIEYDYAHILCIDDIIMLRQPNIVQVYIYKNGCGKFNYVSNACYYIWCGVCYAAVKVLNVDISFMTINFAHHL